MERPPWGRGPEPVAGADDARDGVRTAAAHARLEAARAAYASREVRQGDEELSLAVRLDPEVAREGVALIEQTLDTGPASERLLLYGDLLRAAGRESEAHAAYDRAAEARG
jgi:predicted negative regulator of RcsB-dependent stress response